MTAVVRRGGPGWLAAALLGASAVAPWALGAEPASCAERPGPIGYTGFSGLVETDGADGRRVRMAEVIEGTPAATAGIAPGDRIVGLDGRSFDFASHYEWGHLLGTLRPGDTVHLELRNEEGESREVRVKVGEPPHGWEERFLDWLVHRGDDDGWEAYEWLRRKSAGRAVEVTFHREPSCRLRGDVDGAPAPLSLGLANGLFLLPLLDQLRAGDSLTLSVTVSGKYLRIDPVRMPPGLGRKDLLRSQQESFRRRQEHREREQEIRAREQEHRH